jgi:proline iminopeptidase
VHRRFFDPAYWRIVIFDQRGAGRSTPVGELHDNTPDHLVGDIELLRRELGVANGWCSRVVGSTLHCTADPYRSGRWACANLRAVGRDRPVPPRRPHLPEACALYRSTTRARRSLAAAPAVTDPDPRIHMAARLGRLGGAVRPCRQPGDGCAFGEDRLAGAWRGSARIISAGICWRNAI